MKKILGLISIMILGACTHVDAGNVGVEVDSCSGGGINKTPVGVGYHMTGPCTNIVEFPTYQQVLYLSGSPHEGGEVDDSITVTSSEGLPIQVDCALNFKMDGAKAPQIYDKYRKDIDQIKHSYIKQATRADTQEVFAEYTAQQLYSDKKEIARAEIEKLLIKRLNPEGFLVDQFSISKTTPPPEVVNAIKAKVAMVQQAQQAEQQVAKVKYEAAQEIAKAEGVAKATQLRADAEAYANQKIASSLSPALVHYKLAGKWDGHLSQVSGSTGNMLFSLDGASK